MELTFVFLQNSYVEVVTLDVMLSIRGSLGGNKIR